MIRNTKKAFTLVELIVVITILAILGTIAFISLQGYSGEAKNSKVTSDLRNIASALETSSTRNGTILLDVVTNTWTYTDNAVTWNFWGTGVSSGTLSTTNYSIGSVNFSTIGQNGEDFKDPNSGTPAKDYVFWVVTTGQFKAYQLAWEVIENDVKKARITGTYYEVEAANDVDGLIKARTQADATNALIDWEEIGAGSTNELY